MDGAGLDGAIIPVTGGASGIGLAIGKQLRARGAKPLPLDMNEVQLKLALSELYADEKDPSRFGYVLNVTDSKSVDACFEKIKADHGPVTHAVANAGIVAREPVLEIKDDTWDRVMNVNLNGVLYVCRAAGRQLVENRRGAIVTMGSLAGLFVREHRAAYSASKAAVIQLTKSLAVEFGPFGVRVNSVAPGIINTPIQQAKPAAEVNAVAGRAPLGRMGDPVEIANVVVFLLSDMASFVSGHTIVADGGLSVKYT